MIQADYKLQLTLWNGAHADDRRPLPISASGLRFRPAHSRRGNAVRELPHHGRASRRVPGRARAFASWCGRRTPKWSAWWATSTIGTSAGIPCVCAPAASGKSSFRELARARTTNTLFVRPRAVFASKRPIPTASPWKCRRNPRPSCAISERINGTISSGWTRALTKIISKSRSRSMKSISAPGCAARTIRI